MRDMRQKCRAHPRSRGENVVSLGRGGESPGSSPLTRGKHGVVVHLSGNDGLIPAHAGKTRRRQTDEEEAEAHPRSRGENNGGAPFTWAASGSSPLTRGKHRVLVYLGSGDGLIPAHAGKTSRLPWIRASRRAHPRSRGENVRRCASGMTTSWLIPAHAGKTSCRRSTCHPSAAHPRSRGENLALRARLWSARGSSPLTRGKLSFLAKFRFVPVAHPRSRGENARAGARGHACEGSSPLTRGKLGNAQAHGRAGGLIPAHAGKTRSRGLR